MRDQHDKRWPREEKIEEQEYKDEGLQSYKAHLSFSMLNRHPKEKENKVASREIVIMVGNTKVQSIGETRIKKLQSTIQQTKSLIGSNQN